MLGALFPAQGYPGSGPGGGTSSGFLSVNPPYTEWLAGKDHAKDALVLLKDPDWLTNKGKAQQIDEAQ